MKKSGFTMMAAVLAGAALFSVPAYAEGETYKVGLVQFMDHASLNQIAESFTARLDEIGEEKGVTFNYADYSFNGQGDGSVLNQIGAQLVSDDAMYPAMSRPAISQAWPSSMTISPTQARSNPSAISAPRISRCRGEPNCARQAMRTAVIGQSSASPSGRKATTRRSASG